MSEQLADEIVHALREKSSKSVNKPAAIKVKLDAAVPYTKAALLPESITVDAVGGEDRLSDSTGDVDTIGELMQQNPQRRRKSTMKAAAIAAVDTSRVSQDDSTIAPTDDSASASAAKPKVFRRRKSLVEEEVNPELGVGKPTGKKVGGGRPKKTKGLMDDDEEEDLDLDALSASQQSDRKSRKKTNSTTKARSKRQGQDASGLTPGMSSIHLKHVKATPDRRLLLSHSSPFPSFSPHINMRTGMTPFEHHLGEFDYGSGGDMDFSPGMVFSSPMEGLGGSARRSRHGSLSNLANRDDNSFRLTTIEQSPRTKKSMSLMQSTSLLFSAQKENDFNSALRSSSKGSNKDMTSSHFPAGLMPPPNHPRGGIAHAMDYDDDDDFHAHDDDDHDEQMDDEGLMGSSALDISQIDVNPDFANSPDSMNGDHNTSGSLSRIGNLIGLQTTPQAPRFDQDEGCTPYLKSLFCTSASTEEKDMRKRKFVVEDEEEFVIDDDDVDDVMTGSRLVSNHHHETPSRQHISFSALTDVDISTSFIGTRSSHTKKHMSSALRSSSLSKSFSPDETTLSLATSPGGGENNRSSFILNSSINGGKRQKLNSRREDLSALDNSLLLSPQRPAKVHS